jgi:hypothetical protein
MAAKSGCPELGFFNDDHKALTTSQQWLRIGMSARNSFFYELLHFVLPRYLRCPALGVFFVYSSSLCTGFLVPNAILFSELLRG